MCCGHCSFESDEKNKIFYQTIEIYKFSMLKSILELIFCIYKKNIEFAICFGHVNLSGYYPRFIAEM
jgi:hypothetical protein